MIDLEVGYTVNRKCVFLTTHKMRLSLPSSEMKDKTSRTPQATKLQECIHSDPQPEGDSLPFDMFVFRPLH